MFRIRTASILAALICLSTLALPAAAVTVGSGDVYCFTREDFSPEEDLAGVCITALPDSRVGSVMLGNRQIRPGDILTAQQVSSMTFHCVKTETDAGTQVGYLPVFRDHVAEPEAMDIAVLGKENKVPVVEDCVLETYKNIPLTGKLKVSDPEGETMTYAVIRQSRRGTVAIGEDGSFTYTPKKNKVGVDSFTFTATDAGGKVSREATVTVNILKPTGTLPYTDLEGKDCRFEAEWMKNTGIFAGEKLAGQNCFSPERPINRGEFLTMLVKALEIPTEEDATLTGYTDQIPQWLQPYLAAAVRSGLTEGLARQEVFGAEDPITGPEATVMLRNALDLPGTSVPVWAETGEDAQEALTRSQAAKLLYQASKLNRSSSVFE